MTPTGSAGFRSWGRVFAPQRDLLPLFDRSLPLPAVAGSMLPVGMGRSYGDSCLNEGNHVVCTRGLDRFIAFDGGTGLLRCEPGVLLAEILEFAVPRGWMPPVVPGTKFVTVGGAIANDVHGKNHHRVGTFGHHVPRFELLRSDGARLECSSARNEALYRATIGGLGLTGLVTWAEIQLAPIPGPWIRQSVRPFASLEEFRAASDELERDNEYVVAWLECAPRSALRGLVFAGRHEADARAPAGRATHAFPIELPFCAVNATTTGAFNALYFRRNRSMASGVVDLDRFFFPLDGFRDWNRAYGPRGFFQHQCVVPATADGMAALEALLARVSASGHPTFLGVLKRFGDRAPAGLLSFPRPGFTLALDLPNRGGETRALLESLDAIVVGAGGRLYPAKDARMSASTFQASYPAWRELRDHVDPKFSSSFWRRVTAGA